MGAKTIPKPPLPSAKSSRPSTDQNSYEVEELANGVYAAIAKTGGRATSNAFFLAGNSYVVAGGAHMTREAIADLFAAITGVTDLPVRYFILTHHHPGYSHIDFDWPPGVDVITSWQSWQSLDKEVRKVEFPLMFYSEGMTLKVDQRTVILTNMGKSHTDGDTIVFLPESSVLFTGDLLYVDSVGFMGDGYMQEWVLALEFIERLGAQKIIPGFGPVSGNREINRFKTFFKDFLTEVLRRIEAGDSQEKTAGSFSLPQYQTYEGYDQFMRGNVERAYQDLKKNLLQN